MDSTSKIILFFILCIALGLGIGAGISKIEGRKNATTNLIAQVGMPTQTQTAQVVNLTPPVITAVVSDDAQSDTPASVAPVAKPTAKPYACPVAPAGEPDEWLAPMGPDFSVGYNYIPHDLVLLDNYVQTASTNMCLNSSAALALQSMNTTMKSQGLKILITSAYRPASYQADLRENSEANRNPVTNPYPLVALAGHSEHQLGMAVDILAPPHYTLDDFINTPEYAWIIANSWKYGFIQSYPIGSEAITGYSTESWHYRYVGIANAAAIHNQGITTYQFLKELAAVQSTETN